MTSQPLHFVETLPPEEVARANFYALLARLFYAPPDAALLETLAAAGGIEAEDEGIASAWQALVAAAAGADAEAVRDEYDSRFVGTGKSPVTLYTCAYSVRYASEAPLAQLRGELRGFGLERREGAAEPEDHIAALCDVMRHLIAAQKHSLEEQSRFFQRWIGPITRPLCDAIERDEGTRFYKAVAQFTRAFLLMEQSAFEML